MDTTQKDDVLKSLARLVDERRADLIEANRRDMAACPPHDTVIVDRLKINDAKVDSMIASIKSVLARPDAEGEIISSHTRADGLQIENRRVPFGTILIVYEARPDVSIEAAIIALKAGNRILLKGGREARNSNRFLAELWREALDENSVDTNWVRSLDLSREETRELISGGSERFDLVIPRGGDTLIDFVLKNSSVPVLVSGRGNNFLYIDSEADFEMAVAIALDGKKRLSVCNALDKIVIAGSLVDLKERTIRLIGEFRARGIEVFGDESVCEMDPATVAVKEEMWVEEFLSAKVVIGIVSGPAEAVVMINRHSGGHSAAIVTRNRQTAEAFQRDVDCAAVYHNASVRFTDGGQFGLGAEMAISTQKLHFRGPLGAEHLLTNKWFICGDGQVRN